MSLDLADKKETNTSFSERQDRDEGDTMDLRDVSEGYIIKVTKSKLSNSATVVGCYVPDDHYS